MAKKFLFVFCLSLLAFISIRQVLAQNKPEYVFYLEDDVEDETGNPRYFKHEFPKPPPGENPKPETVNIIVHITKTPDELFFDVSQRCRPRGSNVWQDVDLEDDTVAVGAAPNTLVAVTCEYIGETENDKTRTYTFTDTIFVDGYQPGADLSLAARKTSSEEITIYAACSDPVGSGCRYLRLEGDLAENPFEEFKSAGFDPDTGVAKVKVKLTSLSGNAPEYRYIKAYTMDQAHNDDPDGDVTEGLISSIVERRILLLPKIKLSQLFNQKEARAAQSYDINAVHDVNDFLDNDPNLKPSKWDWGDLDEKTYEVIVEPVILPFDAGKTTPAFWPIQQCVNSDKEWEVAPISVRGAGKIDVKSGPDQRIKIDCRLSYENVNGKRIVDPIADDDVAFTDGKDPRLAVKIPKEAQSRKIKATVLCRDVDKNRRGSGCVALGVTGDVEEATVARKSVLGEPQEIDWGDDGRVTADIILTELSNPDRSEDKSVTFTVEDRAGNQFVDSRLGDIKEGRRTSKTKKIKLLAGPQPKWGLKSLFGDGDSPEEQPSTTPPAPPAGPPSRPPPPPTPPPIVCKGGRCLPLPQPKPPSIPDGVRPPSPPSPTRPVTLPPSRPGGGGIPPAGPGQPTGQFPPATMPGGIPGTPVMPSAPPNGGLIQAFIRGVADLFSFR